MNVLPPQAAREERGRRRLDHGRRTGEIGFRPVEIRMIGERRLMDEAAPPRRLAGGVREDRHEAEIPMARFEGAEKGFKIEVALVADAEIERDTLRHATRQRR